MASCRRCISRRAISSRPVRCCASSRPTTRGKTRPGTCAVAETDQKYKANIALDKEGTLQDAARESATRLKAARERTHDGNHLANTQIRAPFDALSTTAT